MKLDEATDELYASSLDAFVAERARLAKELSDAASPEDAAALAKSRKPTVAAWVLNQLARRNRRDVDLLLDTGHRLREAQAGALSGGDREAFEQAKKAESDALRRLSREAQRLLVEERGVATASTLNQIEETLRVAAISEAGREMLARGRFVEPLQAGGFDVVSELSPPVLKQRPTNARRDEARKANEALKEARSRLRDAERNAAQAAREADRLSSEAQTARRLAEEAQAQVDAAASELEDAENEVQRLRGDR